MRLAYLRADVSRSIGLGHISRAVATAKALERSGIQAVVFCRELDHHQNRAIAKLDKHQNLIRKINDEQEFLSVLEKKEGEYLFIDLLEGPNYASLVPPLKTLFPAYRTICFDSFFDKELKCDLYIGPSFDGTTIHKNGLSDLKYFIFPDELRLLAPTKKAFKSVQRVLISLGGSDPFCVTPDIVRVLCGAFPKLHFTVVVGPGFIPVEREELARLARSYDNVECIFEPDHLGDLYIGSDFSIISGGQTKFEAALFGIPSFILGNTLQEEEFSKVFATWRASIYLGRADQLERLFLYEKFAQLMSDTEVLQEMSRKGKEMLDIHGGERVIAYIQQNLS